MVEKDALYKELERLPMSDKTDGLISEVWKDGKPIGYEINGYTRTPRYTGPTRGLFIPLAKWAEWKVLIAKH
jgi:hypothetical protein